MKKTNKYHTLTSEIGTVDPFSIFKTSEPEKHLESEEEGEDEDGQILFKFVKVQVAWDKKGTDTAVPAHLVWL